MHSLLDSNWVELSCCHIRLDLIILISTMVTELIGHVDVDLAA